MCSDRTVKDILEDLSELSTFFEVLMDGPNVTGVGGEHPLSVIVVRGDKKGVELLLEAGALIDAQGAEGYTALHEAVEQGHSEIVEQLLIYGANPDIKDDTGHTPVEMAKELGNDDIVRIFEKYGVG